MTDRRIFNRLRWSSVLFHALMWQSVFLMSAVAGCTSEEPPTRLIGTWMATSPRHEGRFLEISKEHIVFGADENHSTFYTISNVESEDLESETLYAIEYSGVGGAGRRLRLRLFEGESVAIELENQDGIWIKKDPANSKSKESI